MLTDDVVMKVKNRNINSLTLLSFQMTFTRPANHRQLTFTEIAQSAKIPVNEVGWI